MRGILADINAAGQVENLVRHIQAGPWQDFWEQLNLIHARFEDVGLSFTSSDLDIWKACQAEGLILITDNRNLDSPDSMEAVIRAHNQIDSLPVLTISSLAKLRSSREYVERVVEDMLDYLLRIDDVRGTGRLYLPRKQ